MRVLVLLASLMLVGCTSNSAGYWGPLATEVGKQVGTTKLDPQIARVSERLATHCAELQTAALVVDLFATEKVRSAAQYGQIVLRQFCSAPPRNVSEAIVAVASAYTAIEAARRGS